MPSIVPPASPGARMLRTSCFALLLTGPQLAWAQEFTDGLAAYAARDWARAETLWLVEADAGSADALLGLGNLYDFGLLGETDPVRAFDFYLQSADLGQPEAAFNVAVMYDAGVGVPQDATQAVAWYSFAALEGNARGAYNLGQAFADGTGVATNANLAGYWLREAEPSVPSARAALDSLPPAEGTAAPDAPDPLAFQTYTPVTGPAARMAWAATASPPDARYRVDMVRMGESLTQLASADTTGSAVSIPLFEEVGPVAWRVAQIAGDAYAASAWEAADGTPLIVQPVGSVRFRYDEADTRAEGLVYRLGGAMARFGVIVDYDPSVTLQATSEVTFGYAQDAGLAGDVLAFLPGIGSDGPALRDDPDAAPGEVQVTLSFEQVAR